MKKQVYLLVIFAIPLVSSCASAPRGAAASLAEAGIKSTSAFERDVRDTAAKLEYVDVTEAFSRTWDVCTNTGFCDVQLSSDTNFDQRQKLSQSIVLRAQAASALKAAYKALEQEAEYDARADLSSATSDAVGAVNGFASSIAAIGGGSPLASLISQPISAAFSTGAGIFADSKQEKRIEEANRLIGIATRRFRDALEVEKFVFVSLEDYLANNQKKARLVFLDAGLVSRASILKPITDSLNMTLVKNADAIIAKSPAAQKSVEATVEAQSRADIRVTQRKYDAVIATLDDLLAIHQKLGLEQGISLSALNTNIAILNAALTDQTGD